MSLNQYLSIISLYLFVQMQVGSLISSILR